MTYEELYGEPLPDGLECFFSNLMTSEYVHRHGYHIMIRSTDNSVIRVCGIISMLVEDGQKSVHFLEKHFRNPFKPTEEENTLFEIEHGISYPIEAYK